MDTLRTSMVWKTFCMSSLLGVASAPPLLAQPILSQPTASNARAPWAAEADQSIALGLRIRSDFDLASVVVEVAGKSYPLGKGGADTYSVSLRNDTIPLAGTYPVTFTVTDLLGNTVRTNTQLLLDRLPKIEFIQPREGAVMSDGRAEIDVIGVDDLDSQVDVEVTVGVQTFRGKGRVQATLLLNPDVTHTVIVVARDRLGDGSRFFSFIYPRPSDRLKPLLTVAGEVLDYSHWGAVYAATSDRSQPDPARQGRPVTRLAKVFSEGKPEKSYPYVAGPVVSAHVHSQGFFIKGERNVGFNFGSSAVSPLTVLPQTHHVRGSWGAWAFSPGAPGLVLYSFDRGAFKILPEPDWVLDISAGGDLLYANAINGGWTIYRDRAANPADPLGQRVKQALSLRKPVFQADVPMVFDGETIAYFSADHPQSVALLHLKTATQEIETGIQDTQCQVLNGWVAFTKPGLSGTPQVFTRAPGGVEKQRSIYTAPVELESLLPDGWVTFIVWPSNPATPVVPRPGRYLSIPGVPLPIWLSPQAGRVVWDGDQDRLVLLYHGTAYAFELDQFKIQRGSGSSLALEISSGPAEVWNVQTSTDLFDWADLHEVTNTTGRTLIPLDDASLQPRRYYRAIKR